MPKHISALLFRNIFIAWLRLILCNMFLVFGRGRAVYIAMVNGEWKLVLNVGYNCRTMFSYGNQRLENVDTDAVNGWQDLVGVCRNDLVVFVFQTMFGGDFICG